MADLPTPDPAGQPSLSDAEFERLLALPEVRAIIADLEQRGVFQRQAQNEETEAAGGTDFVCEECGEAAWPLRWGDHRLCTRHYGHEEGFAEAEEWRVQLEREEHARTLQATIPPIPVPPPIALTLIRELTRGVRRRGVVGDPDFIDQAVSAYREAEDQYDRPTDQDVIDKLRTSRPTFYRALSDRGLRFDDIRRLARLSDEK